MRIELKAFAKTNLYLRVLGRRADSYTEIETLFYPVKYIFDELEISFTGDAVSIKCDSKGVPCDSSNLCCKAAEAYFRASGVRCGLEIFLKKNIPVAAGMGGGSSDAASVLLALNRKFGLLDGASLARAALETGSDVPYFLDPVIAVGRGRGEELSRMDFFTPLEVLFADPGFPVSAAWAYKNVDLEKCRENIVPVTRLLEALKAGNVQETAKNLRNDLEYAVFKKFPLLEIVKRKFMDTGASVIMSGSGPALLALYKSRECRLDAASRLAGFASKYGVRIF